MAAAGLLFVHRLVRTSTSGLRRLSSSDALRKCTRTFSAASVRRNEKEGDGSDSRPALLSRWRTRPLSPLERISTLLPPDALSPEVVQLREQNQQDLEEDIQGSGSREEQPEEDDPDTHHASDAQPNEEVCSMSPYLPRERALAFGELLVAEYRRKERVEFRKMFELQAGGRLQSSWGVVLHDDVAGGPAGRFVKTSRGVLILVRRASLEDYVLYMKRGPAIAYPKDAATMLMMMDVSEGDHVLESGSGSGAMSLFLSRAVGCKGSVLSVEVREDHHRRAVLNYKRWRTSWSLRRGEEWPDNVRFENADLGTASSLLAAQAFHAVALDLINPHLVLSAVTPRLHPGAVCAVYLANITQVVDLLEGLRCLALPLLCEGIIEVPVRRWAVVPALQKDGRFCVRKAPIPDGDQREAGDTSDEADGEALMSEEPPAFGSVPYVARPHPEQMSHTAFLVKLRKCLR